jgi:hypothetical protein
MEALKAGFGLSDEELYARFCFDLQMRYALGYDRLLSGCWVLSSTVCSNPSLPAKQKTRAK